MIEWLNAAFAPSTISAWASAIATVGTAFIALYLARASDRRAKEVALKTAALVAARISPMLMADAIAVGGQAQLIGFSEADSSPLPNERVAHIANAVSMVRFKPTYEILLPLTHIKGPCAQLISSAYGLLDQLETELLGHSTVPPSQISETTLSDWEQSLHMAGRNLQSAALVCLHFGKVGLPNWLEDLDPA